MPLYVAQHRYAASRDGRKYGPFVKGERVELTEGEAAWINVDSPGALALFEPDAGPPPQPEPAAEAEAEAEPDGEPEPAKDRAHKGGRRRAS